ncbi:hypothetical protein QJQ45_027906 [Haematococcus lacustris]|nr:hypothetical protein QJQ45_027906 [Haematococcus lacustris]
MACGYGINAQSSELKAATLDKGHVADLIEEANKHPGVTQAVSAASGVWDPATGQLKADQLRRWKLTKGEVKHASGLNNARRDTERWLAPIKPHLQHLAAASSAGTSLEANLKHITVTLATWDAVWEVYLDPKWARQRLRLYGAQDRALEQFFNKLEEDMTELSMKRHGQAKQLVVFFGAATIGTGGGWGADAVLRAGCKVVCRPRGAGQLRGRVVLVDEHHTSRVSSAVNGKQPCEEELDKLSATRPAGWKPPAGQVEPRLVRPAWSQERGQPVRGLMWCPVVAPRRPPQAPRSSQAATQPAASEPGPSTPPPAKRSKQAAEPTKGKGKGKAAKAKPAPQPRRWLDRDCNAALNMQRIGESRWRPLELCYWPDQGALPAKGKEYPGLGYKRLRDKPPKAQEQQQQPTEAQDALHQNKRTWPLTGTEHTQLMLITDFQVDSPSVTYSEEHITSRYDYQTTKLQQHDGKWVVKPTTSTFEFKTDRKVPKLGVMLVGWGGNNGTTLTAGILANKLGITWMTKDGLRKPNFWGSLTQASTVRVGNYEGEEVHTPFKALLPMVEPTDIVLGGWDISGLNMAESMERAQVLDWSLQQQLVPHMRDLVPLPGIYDPEFIAANQEERADNIIKGTKAEQVQVVRSQIRAFKESTGVDKVVVLWTANTERYAQVVEGLNDTTANLMAALERNEAEISPSTQYAIACIEEGVPFVNGSPQNTFVPGVIELAVERNVLIGGDDFKSGQTKLKSVLVDFLVGAGLKPVSIVSYNHLGNNDGCNLSAPQTFRSKEISKSNVVDDMVASNSLLYGPGEHPDHCVVIKYVPYVGDSKRAMDEYTSEIFMGGKNTLVIHNTCEDSLLAAPIILDLVLLAELITRIEVREDGQPQFRSLHPVAVLLSYLTKAPLVPNGTPVVNALPKQRAMLENVMRACIGLAPENNMLMEFKDCNAALNMQRIGESRWRPLELCYWPEQGKLPAKGKEYPGLGYKRLRDKPSKAQEQQQQPAEMEEQLMESAYVVSEPMDASYSILEKPDKNTILEIVGLLKVKTSMLALGACERIKKLAKAHPLDIINSPILPELIHIVEEGPGTPLASAAMGAMATMALVPEGRQRIVMLGGAEPLIKLISRCDTARPNTGKAVQLVMNLAADSSNRRTIREAGGVEALVALMRVAPLEAIMEHCMGALHNVMLTDSKAKGRAVEAGVAWGLARVLAAKVEETHLLAVRGRMLISDLLRIPDMQARLVAAATEQNLRISGLMPNRRPILSNSQIAILLGAGLAACSDYRADPKQSAPVWATLEPSLMRCGRSPLKPVAMISSSASKAYADGAEVQPIAEAIDLTQFGHSLYHAYVDYCRLATSKARAHVVVHSGTPKMTQPQLARMVADMQLLAPAGPITPSILGIIHSSYRPLGSATLTFGTFLQAMAAVSSEARMAPDHLYSCIADLAITRPWSMQGAAQAHALVGPVRVPSMQPSSTYATEYDAEEDGHPTSAFADPQLRPFTVPAAVGSAGLTSRHSVLPGKDSAPRLAHPTPSTHPSDDSATSTAAGHRIRFANLGRPGLPPPGPAQAGASAADVPVPAPMPSPPATFWVDPSPGLGPATSPRQPPADREGMARGKGGSGDQEPRGGPQPSTPPLAAASSRQPVLLRPSPPPQPSPSQPVPAALHPSPPPAQAAPKSDLQVSGGWHPGQQQQQGADALAQQPPATALRPPRQILRSDTTEPQRVPPPSPPLMPRPRPRSRSLSGFDPAGSPPNPTPPPRPTPVPPPYPPAISSAAQLILPALNSPPSCPQAWPVPRASLPGQQSPGLGCSPDTQPAARGLSLSSRASFTPTEPQTIPTRTSGVVLPPVGVEELLNLGVTGLGGPVSKVPGLTKKGSAAMPLAGLALSGQPSSWAQLLLERLHALEAYVGVTWQELPAGGKALSGKARGAPAAASPLPAMQLQEPRALSAERSAIALMTPAGAQTLPGMQPAPRSMARSPGRHGSATINVPRVSSNAKVQRGPLPPGPGTITPDLASSPPPSNTLTHHTTQALSHPAAITTTLATDQADADTCYPAAGTSPSPSFSCPALTPPGGEVPPLEAAGVGTPGTHMGSMEQRLLALDARTRGLTAALHSLTHELQAVRAVAPVTVIEAVQSLAAPASQGPLQQGQGHEVTTSADGGPEAAGSAKASYTEQPGLKPLPGENGPGRPADVQHPQQAPAAAGSDAEATLPLAAVQQCVNQLVQQLLDSRLQQQVQAAVQAALQVATTTPGYHHHQAAQPLLQSADAESLAAQGPTSTPSSLPTAAADLALQQLSSQLAAVEAAQAELSGKQADTEATVQACCQGLSTVQQEVGQMAGSIHAVNNAAAASQAQVQAQAHAQLATLLEQQAQLQQAQRGDSDRLARLSAECDRLSSALQLLSAQHDSASQVPASEAPTGSAPEVAPAAERSVAVLDGTQAALMAAQAAAAEAKAAQAAMSAEAAGFMGEVRKTAKSATDSAATAAAAASQALDAAAGAGRLAKAADEAVKSAASSAASAAAAVAAAAATDYFAAQHAAAEATAATASAAMASQQTELQAIHADVKQWGHSLAAIEQRLAVAEKQAAAAQELGAVLETSIQQLRAAAAPSSPPDPPALVPAAAAQELQEQERHGTESRPESGPGWEESLTELRAMVQALQQVAALHDSKLLQMASTPAAAEQPPQQQQQQQQQEVDPAALQALQAAVSAQNAAVADLQAQLQALTTSPPATVPDTSPNLASELASVKALVGEGAAAQAALLAQLSGAETQAAEVHAGFQSQLHALKVQAAGIAEGQAACQDQLHVVQEQVSKLEALTLAQEATLAAAVSELKLALAQHVQVWEQGRAEDSAATQALVDAATSQAAVKVENEVTQQAPPPEPCLAAGPGSEVQQLQEQQQQHEQQLLALSASLTAVAAKVQQWETEWPSSKQELEELQGVVKELQGSALLTDSVVSTEAQPTQELYDAVAHLEATVRQQLAQPSEPPLVQQLQAVQADVARCLAELSQLQGDVGKAKAEAEDSKAAAAGVTADIAIVQQEVAGLQTYIEHTKQGVQKAQAAADAAAADLQYFKDTADQLRADSVHLAAQGQHLWDESEQRRTEVMLIKADTDQLQVDVAQLKLDAADSTASAGQQSAAVEKLSAAMRSLQSDAEQLRQALTTVPHHRGSLRRCGSLQESVPYSPSSSLTRVGFSEPSFAFQPRLNRSPSPMRWSSEHALASLTSDPVRNSQASDDIKGFKGAGRNVDPLELPVMPSTLTLHYSSDSDPGAQAQGLGSSSTPTKIDLPAAVGSSVEPGKPDNGPCKEHAQPARAELLVESAPDAVSSVSHSVQSGEVWGNNGQALAKVAEDIACVKGEAHEALAGVARHGEVLAQLTAQGKALEAALGELRDKGPQGVVGREEMMRALGAIATEITTRMKEVEQSTGRASSGSDRQSENKRLVEESIVRAVAKVGLEARQQVEELRAELEDIKSRGPSRAPSANPSRRVSRANSQDMNDEEVELEERVQNLQQVHEMGIRLAHQRMDKLEQALAQIASLYESIAGGGSSQPGGGVEVRRKVEEHDTKLAELSGALVLVVDQLRSRLTEHEEQLGVLANQVSGIPGAGLSPRSSRPTSGIALASQAEIQPMRPLGSSKLPSAVQRVVSDAVVNRSSNNSNMSNEDMRARDKVALLVAENVLEQRAREAALKADEQRVAAQRAVSRLRPTTAAAASASGQGGGDGLPEPRGSSAGSSVSPQHKSGTVGSPASANPFAGMSLMEELRQRGGGGGGGGGGAVPRVASGLQPIRDSVSSRIRERQGAVAEEPAARGELRMQPQGLGLGDRSSFQSAPGAATGSMPTDLAQMLDRLQALPRGGGPSFRQRDTDDVHQDVERSTPPLASAAPATTAVGGSAGQVRPATGADLVWQHSVQERPGGFRGRSPPAGAMMNPALLAMQNAMLAASTGHLSFGQRPQSNPTGSASGGLAPRYS